MSENKTASPAPSVRRFGASVTFRNGDEVLGEQSYPLVEGPIGPGQRLSFSRPFHDPPDGTTNVVPSVE